MKRRIAVLVSLAVLLAACPALAGEGAGIVKTLKGDATIVRQGKALPVQVGTALTVGDLLRTGPESAIGLILADNTLIALGPASELLLNDFAFSPAEQDLSLALRLMKGTASFLSGLIGKLAPETVRVETPDASVGIRGTRFALRVD